MFITPKVVAAAHSSSPVSKFQAVKFQGVHITSVTGSLHIGRDPETGLDVFVTDDNNERDPHKPGADRARYLEVTKLCSEMIAAGFQPPKAYYDFMELIFKQARELYEESQKAQYPTSRKHSKRPSSRHHKEPNQRKQVLLAAFIAFLTITGMILGPKQEKQDGTY